MGTAIFVTLLVLSAWWSISSFRSKVAEKTTTGWRGTQWAQVSATWVDSREVGGDTSTAPVTSKEHTK